MAFLNIREYGLYRNDLLCIHTEKCTTREVEFSTFVGRYLLAKPSQLIVSINNNYRGIKNNKVKGLLFCTSIFAIFALYVPLVPCMLLESGIRLPFLFLYSKYFAKDEQRFCKHKFLLDDCASNLLHVSIYFAYTYRNCNWDFYKGLAVQDMYHDFAIRNCVNANKRYCPSLDCSCIPFYKNCNGDNDPQEGFSVVIALLSKISSSIDRCRYLKEEVADTVVLCMLFTLYIFAMPFVFVEIALRSLLTLSYRVIKSFFKDPGNNDDKGRRDLYLKALMQISCYFGEKVYTAAPKIGTAV